MNKLPDFEALAAFAKVAELRSFAAAAEALGVSKGTVSKAIQRLEQRLGTTLLHRSSRRFALTECGRSLSVRAAQILAAAEAAEADALENTVTPKGLVRLAVPMSFGLTYVAPALTEFLRAHPDVSIDLHLSDEIVDLVGQGIDCALRIAALPDSSMLARKLRPVERYVVAAPSYIASRGRPAHPSELAKHACLCYANLPTPQLWRFRNDAGDEVSVRPSGPLRVNNADAYHDALCAGLGVAVQPDFLAWRDLAEGRLERVLDGWRLPQIALHLVTPASAPRPMRVAVLIDFLTRRFSRAPWEAAD
jgi:DNA-binding transcriptional LysR family regulator